MDITLRPVTVLSGVVVGVLALVAVAAALATRVPSLERPVRVALVVVEAMLAFVVVADLGLVLRADEADRPGSMLTHIGYAVAAVGLLPLLAWRRPPVDDPDAEVEPVSLWVVVITLVAVAVCVVRLAQTR